MKTFTLTGGLAGPPSACSCAENRIDVFAAGPGTTVWRWSWEGTSWALPAPLPPLPAGRGIPAEGVCAVSSGPGRVEVFAAESATRSPVWWRGDGTAWSVEPPLPGGANLPAEPVAAVCASPNNIDVFAAGAGNTPWWWHWNGSSWTLRPALPVGANLPAERIAAVSAAPGRLDVFAAGAGNHLWHWSTVGGGSWALEDLGGNVPQEGVSAVSWGPNRIDVFAASRDPGNPLQHWWSDGGGFAGPESLGGNLAQGTVSAVSHAANRLDVFGISGDKRLAHWQWDGANWIGPSSRGDNIPAGDVSAVVRKSHRLDVFVAGVGNTLRQWPGGGLENATTEPWRNWPTNHEKNPPVGHLRPDSLEELVNIVREAEALGRGVRAVGSSWSNSDVAVSPGYVVQTNRLNHVLTDVLDTSLNAVGSGLRSRLVHVEAGIKLHELNAFLDERGLALKTMGGSSGQSLAGVLSTSAHGMDFDRPPIPDMVRAIHLVGPGGVQHWIEPRNGITTKEGVKAALGLADGGIHYDDEWFNSALVSMGSLGIIYSLVVEVEPQYDLVDTREVLDWSTMKARLKGGSPSPFDGIGLQVVINPYPGGDGSRPCYPMKRTLETASHPVGESDFQTLVDLAAPGILAELRLNPSRIDEWVRDLTSMAQGAGTKRGWAHTIRGGPKAPAMRGLTVELVFDATNTRYLDFIDAALEILYQAYYVETPPYGYLGWISLRFQGHSRAYLSPHHQSSRTCTVEFAAVYRNPDLPHVGWADTPNLIARIEAKGREYGGIQHWGMNGGMNAFDVARAYPRLDTWRRVRWELTKGGTITTFDSDFTRRCGLSDAPHRVAVADYDNDGKSDFAIWRPSTGTWWVINSSTGAQRSQKLGAVGDIPVPGSYNAAGKTNFATWRPSTGTWQVLPTKGQKQRSQKLGQAGDIPVPGDYDGDRKTDFAVWRPSDGMWYVIDSSTSKRRSKQWGQLGDIPVPGDYDGDGKTDFAVWRPAQGMWLVLVSSSGAGFNVQFGQEGDIPVPGDYNGDGRTELAVWRPRDGNWHVRDLSTGATRSQQWGLPNDIPVPGRYDADSKTDFAVWRPSDGMWWVIDSSTGAQRSQQWGMFGDIPV